MLIDEIDKSDLDFANDLLNLIEDGEYDIPELQRLGELSSISVKDVTGRTHSVLNGRLVCGQFPFVVMTSNGEREFPSAFLRRCVRLTIDEPTVPQLTNIIDAHMAEFLTVDRWEDVNTLITKFVADRLQHDVSTDQLLNAVFLTIALRGKDGRTFTGDELEEVRTALARPLSGTAA